MSLAAGTRLGPYEISSFIGAGGMGEVYKALDTRLHRTVAIKVLPAEASADPDSRARFEREARAIAALDHPHICTLHDVGCDRNIHFLVMEYLDGEPLAARLSKGRLPLSQMLEVGSQIADALSRAHRAGIVHRDLKPGNVMLTKDGAKLLDFGLARLKAAPLAGTAAESTRSLAAQMLPGTIVGTLSYMAPEQLEGREADARSDLFALGAVLYEMATGRRAFDGQSSASVIAAVLESEPPPLSAIEPVAPASLDRLVRRCLAKDPDQRCDSAHEVAAQLRWIAEGGDRGPGETPVLGPPRRRLMPIVTLMVAIAVLAAIVFVGTPRFLTSDRPGFVVVSSIVPPHGVALIGNIELSPDGRHLAFTGQGSDGIVRLWLDPLEWVRPPAASKARALAGTEGAEYPFWSPDSRSVGFRANGTLMVVDIASGVPEEIATDAGRGATWSADGTIVFTRPGGGLFQRLARGGDVKAVTTAAASRDETDHRWPAFLPDARHVLFLARSTRPGQRLTLAVTSLDDPSRITYLAPAASPGRYIDGHVLFIRGTTLFAQRFDIARRELSGAPVPILDDVWLDGAVDGLAGCSMSQAMIACRRGNEDMRLAWVDRDGKELGSIGPFRASQPSMSPDGQRVIVRVPDSTGIGRLWVLGAHESDAWPLSRDEGMNAVWAPDASAVAFASDVSGRKYDVYVQKVERGSREQLLFASPDYFKSPSDWSRDGKWILLGHQGGIWKVPASGGAAEPVISTNAQNGRLSPDMKWMAFTSAQSGRQEVYLATFPKPGGWLPVSVDGGSDTHWSADGHEMFFMAGDRKLMVVRIDTQRPDPRVTAPRVLFERRAAAGMHPAEPAARNYCSSPDGTRFLVNTLLTTAEANGITLIQNWTPRQRPSADQRR